MSALKPGLTNAEMTRVVFLAILRLLERKGDGKRSPWDVLRNAAYDLFPERQLTWENIDFAICRHHSTEATYPSMIGVSFLRSMERQLLATQAEVEELRAENERLRSVIASLMPGDAGRVE